MTDFDTATWALVEAARAVDASEVGCCPMALFALSEHEPGCPRVALRGAFVDFDEAEEREGNAIARSPLPGGWTDAEIAARKAQGIGGGAPHAESAGLL